MNLESATSTLSGINRFAGAVFHWPSRLKIAREAVSPYGPYRVLRVGNGAFLLAFFTIFPDGKTNREARNAKFANWGAAMIGIVGGVGPYAGLDLARKVFDNTIARSDQEHLPLVLLSEPGSIPDRTAFLLGEERNHPGPSLAEIVLKLESVGATVVGIPCNTAHAPEIWQVMQKNLRAWGSRVAILHMIEETVRFIVSRFPETRRVGVLSTFGTWRTELYPNALARLGLEAVVPDEELARKVHAAIYDVQFGIKAFSNPVTQQAREEVVQAIRRLKSQGAEVVILGCTELPLAVPEQEIAGCPLIDPTNVLARALIHAVAPEKLVPLAENK